MNGKKAKARPLCARLRGIARSARATAEQESRHPELAQHADMIRELGKRVLKDILEIGRRLAIAKGLVPHGEWEEWLETEFGWSSDTALNFMRVHEFSQDYESRKFRDLKIAPSAIYLLSQRNTPVQVRDEIIGRAEAGEEITHKTVKAAIWPEPEEAAQEAAPEESEEQEVSKSAWMGRMLIAANKAAGLARIEDWTQFEVDAGLTKAAEEAANAWHRVVAHLRGSAA
jgi:hypothetical protein